MHMQFRQAITRLNLMCCSAGDAPVHAPPDVPPASWIDDMRTPPLEAVLSQFRAQKGGPAATDGAVAAMPTEATAPTEAAAPADAAAEDPVETPRSGGQAKSCAALLGPCHRQAEDQPYTAAAVHTSLNIRQL